MKLLGIVFAAYLLSFALGYSTARPRVPIAKFVASHIHPVLLADEANRNRAGTFLQYKCGGESALWSIEEHRFLNGYLGATRQVRLQLSAAEFEQLAREREKAARDREKQTHEIMDGIRDVVLHTGFDKDSFEHSGSRGLALVSLVLEGYWGGRSLGETKDPPCSSSAIRSYVRDAGSWSSIEDGFVSLLRVSPPGPDSKAGERSVAGPNTSGTTAGEGHTGGSVIDRNTTGIQVGFGVTPKSHVLK